MENEFKRVEMNFGNEYTKILKLAMSLTIEQTCVSNTTIEFTDMGFNILELTKEKFLFSFAMNYGKLLAKKETQTTINTLKEARSILESTGKINRSETDKIHSLIDSIIYILDK